MPSASERVRGLRTAGVAFAVAALACATVPAAGAQDAAACDKPVYLTLDTGHMGIAPLVADVLKRQDVRVTFFAAAERTQTDGDSLDDHWAPWWKARAAEGHEFGSHTYDHAYWRGDVKGTPPSFRIKPSAGPQTGKESVWSAAQYCADIRKSSDRLAAITGKKPLPLYRAPGGKTSPALLAAARDCGYAHVGWSPAGFLGDELPSEAFSNQKLLAQALAGIRPGDILLAHLGIWSRKDPWAPANLEPLIVGLKAKGFCFRTLRQHPDYRAWIASHP
ncbi:polysaccharide deacetylase family protein [Variovorax sp. V118]|uniref:polysaccharide deacetylase family protein n=1 Tax=Variovorax sp. V118 TaxID=3065954 RepID=UPI0034E8E81D